MKTIISAVNISDALDTSDEDAVLKAELNILINNTWEQLNQYESSNESNEQGVFTRTANLMSIVDKKFNYEDTIEVFNRRLRTSVANCFNKDFNFGDNHEGRNVAINAFKKWENNLSNLPLNASRNEIFDCGNIKAFNIIGI